MKKLLLISCIGLFTTTVNAQGAADKNIQAGLVTGFGINFQKMGTKLVDADGVGTDLTIGANVNFSLTETIGLNTGVEFDFETLKYKPSGSNIYYRYNDTKILSENESSSSDELFMLSSRKQKPVYLSIPVMMLFRTNFIGYFRYYGKFGIRNSFLLKNKIDDVGYNFPQDGNPILELNNAVKADNENMSAAGEMLFFKSAVGLVGGVEWNFTGSTCLVGELGYYYGFTPLHIDRKSGKEYLFTTDENGNNPEYFSNKATQGQLMFKLSVLF